MDLSNLLVPAMLFFDLGLFAQLIRSDLKFHDLTKVSTIYLLVKSGGMCLVSDAMWVVHKG